MRWRRSGSFYQLRLERGEEIVQTLVEFIRARQIRSGVMLGLGAGTDITLGAYNLKQRVYHRRRFRGEYEICSLVGNIAWGGTEPICHIHAVISNERLVTYSGHLFAGKVAATCEVNILPGTAKILRALESDSGLKLLQF